MKNFLVGFIFLMQASFSLNAQVWSNSQFADGSIIQNSSDNFTINGNNNETGGYNYIYLTVPKYQKITFDWSYYTNDVDIYSYFDPFYFRIGSEDLTKITNDSSRVRTQSGTSTIVASSSGVIQLGIYSIDGVYGNAYVTISNLKVESPTFANPGPITLCQGGSYYLAPSITYGTWFSTDSTKAIVDSRGYVTGVSIGSAEVSLTTAGGTVTATVTVVADANPSLSITDPLAQAAYKINNNPQGPIGGTINYVGYNGYSYSSQTRPINSGFYKASMQSGNEAGCPYQFYIYRCSTCGTVPSYGLRPKGTLTGNTSGTGQLAYTSSNQGGPFTIVYQATGASPVTVNNISSTVAFNVVTPTITTSYKLISVTDEITNASTDFSVTTATITVPLPHFVGESFGGGIVFYVDGTGQHGLIAATSDQSNGIAWGPYSTTEATATAMGTGLANTTKIISSQGETATNYAAGLASTYNGGGNNVWYLPSKDELNLMYTNIGNAASPPNYNIGGFEGVYYWSSTESGYVNAWGQNFLSGFQSTPLKSVTIYVRAIRAF